MPTLEAKKALFAHVAGFREKRREPSLDEVELSLFEREEKGTSMQNARRKTGSSCRANSGNLESMLS